MAYGHAERNLALLRQLEAETRQLLESLDQPDPEQSAWLQRRPAEEMTDEAPMAGRAGYVAAGPADDGHERETKASGRSAKSSSLPERPVVAGSREAGETAT